MLVLTRDSDEYGDIEIWKDVKGWEFSRFDGIWRQSDKNGGCNADNHLLTLDAEAFRRLFPKEKLPKKGSKQYCNLSIEFK